MTTTAFVTNLWANASANARADDPPAAADGRAAVAGSEAPSTGHDAQPASLPSVDPLAQFGAGQQLHPAVRHLAYADKNGTGGGKTNSVTGTAQAKSAPVHERTPKELSEIARDPRRAHEEWKSLGIVERGVVLDQMERRYGKDFAQKFFDVAKSGKPDFTVATWQPPPIGPTRERLLELGYRFAGEEHTGTAWIVVHTWVHPSGKHIRMIVDTPSVDRPEKDKCELSDPAEMLKVELLEIEADLDEDKSRQQAAVAAKEKLDHMNFASPQYAKAYDAYVNLMEEGIRRVGEQLELLTEVRKELAQCGADLSKIDEGRDELEELQNWFEVNRQLLDQEGRRPIKVDIK